MMFVTLEIIVLRRIKSNIEWQQLLFLIAFSVSFIVRLSNVIIRLATDKDADLTSSVGYIIVYIIQIIANEITAFIVYKFMIEMREVKIKLQATTLEQY